MHVFVVPINDNMSNEDTYHCLDRPDSRSLDNSAYGRGLSQLQCLGFSCSQRGLVAAIIIASSIATFTVLLLRGGSLLTPTTTKVGSAECVTNIFIVRHCDKEPAWAKDPTPDAVCTVEGELRGEYLAHIFGPGGKYPVPQRLYGRSLLPGFYSNRDLYLLWPLAQRLGILINTSFGQEEPVSLAQALTKDREATCSSDGIEDTVLVSWNHCEIPALSQSLGCHRGRCVTCWDDGDFETILWLRFATSKGPTGPWNLTLRVDKEGFTKSTRILGNKECEGSDADSTNFGFSCRPPSIWRNLPKKDAIPAP